MKGETAARRKTAGGAHAPTSARRRTVRGKVVKQLGQAPRGQREFPRFGSGAEPAPFFYAARMGALFWVAGLLGAGAVLTASGEEQRFDFRESRFDNARLRLLGEGIAELLVPERDGLRVTIPQGAAVEEVGFAPRFGLRGDFEIIVTVEVIDLPTPTSGYGVGPRIYIAAATEDEQAATVARLRRIREGDVFSAHNARYLATKDGGRERKHKIFFVPAAGKVARIGLRRTGTKLQYLASEGDGAIPVEISSWTFTAADVPSVRISLHGHGAAAAGEVRWNDVVIRADEFVRPRTSHGAGRVLALGALLASIAVGIGVWRYRRRRA